MTSTGTDPWDQILAQTQATWFEWRRLKVLQRGLQSLGTYTVTPDRMLALLDLFDDQQRKVKIYNLLMNSPRVSTELAHPRVAAAIMIHFFDPGEIRRHMTAAGWILPTPQPMVRYSSPARLHLPLSVYAYLTTGAILPQVERKQATLVRVQPGPPPGPGSQRRDCVACLAVEVDTVMVSCGHRCYCRSCAQRVGTGVIRCPLCRAEVRELIQTY